MNNWTPSQPPADRSRTPLSPRQLLCLERVAWGDTSHEIAADLGLSVRTVDQHVADACERLGVRKRASAVAIAMQRGWIDPPPLPD